MRPRRLVAVTMSATFPPRRGNQIRTASLLGSLGPDWLVESHSLTVQRTDLPLPRRRHRASARWVDNRTRDPIATAWTIAFARLEKPPVYVHKLIGLWPHRHLTRALATADAVLVSPPYQFSWVRKHTPRSTPVVLDEHSIEADLYRDPRAWWTRAIAREVERVERESITGADLVFVTSDEDGVRVRNWGARRVALVPNGVDLRLFTPVARERKHALRAELGLPANGSLAVFVGSGHPPNVEAVGLLEKEAAAYRKAGITVVVIGRCGLGRQQVDGITLVGEVADVPAYLQAADIALCPLQGGSGTSLKVIEYLAVGTPVISTGVGVRGLGLKNGVEFVLSDAHEMPGRAAALLSDPHAMHAMSRAGIEAVARFSWDPIGRAAADELGTLVTSRADEARIPGDERHE